jgi:hypothetical protein
LRTWCKELKTRSRDSSQIRSRLALKTCAGDHSQPETVAGLRIEKGRHQVRQMFKEATKNTGKVTLPRTRIGQPEGGTVVLSVTTEHSERAKRGASGRSHRRQTRETRNLAAESNHPSPHSHLIRSGLKVQTAIRGDARKSAALEMPTGSANTYMQPGTCSWHPI